MQVHRPSGTKALSVFLAVLAATTFADAALAQPSWSVNPADFANAMYVVAQVEIGGSVSDNPDNIVASFVGGQTTGVATPTDVNGDILFFLTVHCENASGATATFQVWDADEDEVKIAAESLECKDGDVHGTIDSPFSFSVAAAAGGAPVTNWSVDPSDFEFSMQVIAELHIDGSRSDHLSNQVAAFNAAGTEIRGFATPIFIADPDRTLYLLSVFGNTGGEEITFKAYDADADEIKPINETLDFQDSHVEGSAGSPFVLNAGGPMNEPEWTVDPSQFESDMQVIGVLHIDNVLSNHADNIIGAFVGTDVRGVATPVSVNGTMTFFLTIHGNTGGEHVTFKAYDAAGDAIKDIAESVSFSANVTEGSSSDPFVWHTGSLSQSCTLTGGWNWFSVSVIPSNLSVGTVLAGLSPADGDIIKNPDISKFSIWDDGQWLGSLNSISAGDGYKIRLSNSGTFTNTGSAAPTTLEVVSGWNLIGFPKQAAQTVTESLSSLSLHMGDIIKSDHATFSEFNLGWQGPLATLEPCEAYMLNVQDPGTISFLMSRPAAPATSSRSQTGSDLTVNPAQFEHSMNVIGTASAVDAAIIAAYVGDELRGFAEPLVIDGDTYYFLTVHGSAEGEEISFRGINGTVERPLQGSLDFMPDAVHGSIRNPFQWTPASSVSVDDAGVPNSYALGRNYPNPFNPSTSIEITLPEAANVQLVVYDVAGRAVRTLVDAHRAAGRHEVVWNARDDAGRPVASGVYMYRLKTEAYVETRTLVLMK